MQPINRVKSYYNMACRYLALPLASRYMIGRHLGILNEHHLAVASSVTIDEEIFREVFKRDIYYEFVRITKRYKKSVV